MSKSIPFVRTAGGITLIIDNQSLDIASTHERYAEVIAALKEKATEEQIKEILFREKIQLEKALSNAPQGISFDGETIKYEDEVIEPVLAERMLSMLKEGFDLNPLVNFIRNLRENPSNRISMHLYPFLEKGKVPITEDGCFLVYKAVRRDYKDIHSGTFDNSVGAVVSMPRRKVDEDPNRTCSYGLHVCSFGYLPHFSHADGHVMICKVNPADVVAIPEDYNHTKMRVCKYTVIGEYQGYYKNEGDTLSKATVGYVDEDCTFQVEESNDGVDFTFVEGFDRLSEASAKMEDLLEEGFSDIHSYRIVNNRTGSVVTLEENPDYFDDSDVALDSGDQNLSFEVYGVDAQHGHEVFIEGDFETEKLALIFAMEQEDDRFNAYIVKDSNGNFIRSMTSSE